MFKDKGSISIPLGVLIILLVGGGAYYLGSQKNFTPTAPRNSMNDWKVYTNETHKYTLKYPSNWNLDATEANNQEDFADAICCNTATLSISNGNTRWELLINPLITGFQAPDECEGGPGKCSFTHEPIQVLDLSLERTLVRLNSTNNIIEGYISAPEKSRGFGNIDTKSDYVAPNQIKYLIDYRGSEIGNNLGTLDLISKSLYGLN